MIAHTYRHSRVHFHIRISVIKLDRQTQKTLHSTDLFHIKFLDFKPQRPHAVDADGLPISASRGGGERANQELRFKT